MYFQSPVGGRYLPPSLVIMATIASPTLDTSQVSPRQELAATVAVSDQIEEEFSGRVAPAPQHATEVMRALGGSVSLTSEGKAAFARGLVENSREVEVENRFSGPPAHDF